MSLCRMNLKNACNPFSTLSPKRQSAQESDDILLNHAEEHVAADQRQQPLNNFIITIGRGDDAEIKNELRNLNLDSRFNGSGISLSIGSTNKSNDSLSGASTASASGAADSTRTYTLPQNGAGKGTTLTPPADNGAALVVGPAATATNNGAVGSVKKRISSSRTPTRKARRVKFYRNGDRFFPGITIPVSNERYRLFESLFVDLTRLLEDNVKLPGAVRTIYTMCGKKISTLEELEDGQSYICSCNNENFKKVDYVNSSQPVANANFSTKANNRLSKVIRPSSPLKNGGGTFAVSGTNGSPQAPRVAGLDSVVHPRIVTLIRHGTKPRKIVRLLLNKRNSPSFDHVLTAITQAVRLDTGYVRRVFTLSGSPVVQLADFFGANDIFFAHGTERIHNPDDFKLDADEQKAIHAIRRNLRIGSTASKGGPKPKMPAKSNIYNGDSVEEAHDHSGIKPSELPAAIREHYTVDDIIGDGNFAIVLKVTEKRTGRDYALKVIDKSKCKGKEHYIDAEVRVMKQLLHSHIIALMMDFDKTANMYLLLEYVSGGDLFDAITRVTRFSEDQSRLMINHLALALSYLHSKSIVHRDIKPENLLVEYDNKNNIVLLKLGDFGLACEVFEPLTAVCGTPTYVAPEILMETGYGLKIDVWAAGVILYILLCGFPPFISQENEQESLFDAIISGVYEFPAPYWDEVGDGVRDLIANMLQIDPDVRFTSEDILDHYWTMNMQRNSDYS